MAKNLSFKQRLKQIGLSDNEATVYLAVLEKGRITPTEVANETGLNHVTSYRVLKYLVEKKLISETREGEKKLYFSIEDPDHVRWYLRRKRQEVEDQEGYLDELLPNLKTIYESHKRLKIDFFEGKEGVYWLQEEMSKIAPSIDATYEIVPIDQASRNFPRRKNDPRDKFKGKGVVGLYTSKEDYIELKNNPKIKSKFIKNVDFNKNVELFVADNYTYFIIHVEEIGGILIRDKEVADFFKKLIILLYKILP